MLVDSFRNFSPIRFRIRISTGFRTKSDRSLFLAKFFSTKIRSHDDDGTLERDNTTFIIFNLSFIEDLEKNIEYITICFFYLIQKDDAIWFSSHLFGQHTTRFISYISWCRTDKFRDIITFHKF